MSEIFRRIERKYLVNKQQHDMVIERVQEKMRKDYYCKDGAYYIYNLYFDNDSNHMIHRSNQKPYYKEKIRVRTYDLKDSKQYCFLEIKRKVGKIVSKRRISAPLDDLNDLVYKENIPPVLSQKEKQIAKEISYLIKRYASYPKVFLSYRREAYYDKENDNFRITFDNELLYRYDNIEFTNGNYGLKILDDDMYIMEIKFEDSLPLWISRVLSELKIYPASYSKYGEIYKSYLKENI